MTLAVCLLTLGALVAPYPGVRGVIAGARAVILATTTSTVDSGLLDVLVPMFERASGYSVKTIGVGTGQALALGDRGEADVVLVHAPELELEYARKGALVSRRLVMHNDFVVVGPPGDPAGAARATTAIDALLRIAHRRAPWVSRGDGSGTHARERALWKAAGVTPERGWYVESGQGMGQTLVISSEKRAYTLSDRATYLAFRKRVALGVVFEGDAALLNVYHAMEVNPARHPAVNAAGAAAFVRFLVSAPAQDAIRTFGVDRYGSPLFVPDAGKTAPAGTR